MQMPARWYTAVEHPPRSQKDWVRFRRRGRLED